MSLALLTLLIAQSPQTTPHIPTVTAAPTSSQKPTVAEDYGATWKTIQEAIESRYYARQTRHAEMERLLTKYSQIAPKARSRDEFESIVNAMIAEFKDSHFSYLTTQDQAYYLMDGLVHPKAGGTELAEFGAWFRSTAAGSTVQMVLNGSEAEKADLRKGDVVLSVDGSPFSPVLSLADKVNSTVQLRIRREGTELTKSVQIKKQTALEMFLDASKASSKVWERGGRKIGYYHLWTQASEDFRSALANAVYGKLRDTDAFVLDLRDGFGGRPEGYADPFFRPEVTLSWNTQPGQGMKELFGYQRPLVVLINEGSRSAKEVLSYVLKKSGRAVLVGQTTAGNVLGTFPMRVNDWSYLEIPMVDVLADGDRLEGHGVEPNVPIAREIDAEGRDLDLEAGLDLAAKQARTSKGKPANPRTSGARPLEGTGHRAQGTNEIY